MHDYLKGTGTDHATDAQTAPPHALACVHKATAPGGCASVVCLRWRAVECSHSASLSDDLRNATGVGT